VSSNRARVIYSLLSGAFLITSLFLIIAGGISEDIGMTSLGVMFVWCSAFTHALGRRERNVIYLLFLFTIFLFLLSRVVVRWILYREVYMPFDYDIMRHVYLCIYLSIIGLWMGSFTNLTFHPRQYNEKPLTQSLDYEALRTVLKPLTLICGFAQLARAVEKSVYWFASGSLGDLQINYATNLPSIVLRISFVYVLFLCMYLATFPTKKQAFPVLIQLLIIEAMKMVYGHRSDFVLGLMFIFVYYSIRDRFDDEIWIGRKEKLFTVVSIPLLIILLVFIGYYRKQNTFEFNGLLNVLWQFFESQGTSINILGYAAQNADKLPQPNFLYLFDTTYTFLSTNPVSSLIFGTKSYSVNTVGRALYGTSLEQALYYIINPTSYLAGYGGGSSYIAEIDVGYGYFGMILINLILSNVIYKINIYDYRSYGATVIILAFLKSLFIIPRAGFDSFVGELISVTHIIALLLVWALYQEVKRRRRASVI
jgi:oligosaccharide repeat unit polymerase